MSVEGIALYHFSALSYIETISPKKPCPCHAVFHYFLSDDIKQYAATTTAHSKSMIDILKEQKVLTSTLITIW